MRGDDVRPGLPPAEVNQCLVWLEGFEDYFFVPGDGPAGNTAVELKLIDFLMQCFDTQRKVKVEYYAIANRNFISAVWANA